MSNFDNLMKGLAAFDQGMTQYAISTSVKDATQQVAELNARQPKPDELLAGQNDIAQKLAGRLTSAGADPGQIQAMTQQIAPSMAAQYSAKQTASESKLARQNRLDLKKMDLEAASARAATKKDTNQIDMDLKQQDKFYAQNKEAISAIQAAQTIGDMLSPDKNGRIDFSQTRNAAVKVARTAGDNRISNEDMKSAQANPNVKARIAREAGIAISGEALKDDVKFYTEYAQRMAEKGKARLAQKADEFASGYSATAQYSPEQSTHFRDTLKTKYGLNVEPQQPQTNAAGQPINEAGIAINPNKGKQQAAPAPMALPPDKEKRRQELLKKQQQGR